MNNLNSCLIEGNLTRDPEMKYTGAGTAVCMMSLAVNRSFKKGDGFEKEVSFFDVQAWARLAEVCGEYLKKGRGVRVVGRLKQQRWTDKAGSPISRVVIEAEHVEFKPMPKQNGGQEEAPADETSPGELDD